MKAINSAITFEKDHVYSKDTPETSVDNETAKNSMDHFDEPSYFFRGAIFGLIFCAPFWAVIFWLITR